MQYQVIKSEQPVVTRDTGDGGQSIDTYTLTLDGETLITKKSLPDDDRAFQASSCFNGEWYAKAVQPTISTETYQSLADLKAAGWGFIPEELYLEKGERNYTAEIKTAPRGKHLVIKSIDYNNFLHQGFYIKWSQKRTKSLCTALNVDIDNLVSTIYNKWHWSEFSSGEYSDNQRFCQRP